MEASHNQIKKDNAFGHNIASIEKFIQEKFEEYAECDEQSGILSKARQKIREEIEAKGLDKKAWHDQYMLAKRKRKEKEGYAETAKISWEALNKMDTGNLFSFLDKAEAEKAKEKEAKEKAKAAKPKKSKEAEATDTGKAQAAAYLSAAE